MLRRVVFVLSAILLAFMPVCVAFVALVAAPADAQDSYDVERIEVPKSIRLEVGGMGFWDDGTLVMCTRRGEVWLYKDGQFKV